MRKSAAILDCGRPEEFSSLPGAAAKSCGPGSSSSFSGREPFPCSAAVQLMLQARQEIGASALAHVQARALIKWA